MDAALVKAADDLVQVTADFPKRSKQFFQFWHVCRNLADWRYEGVIYAKGEDPFDPDGTKNYYAPDVVQGNSGRYYLYCLICDSNVLSVAVADRPEGNITQGKG